MSLKITDIRHPEYTCQKDHWDKWRIVAKGGDEFIDHYVKKFSEREGDSDFNKRKTLTPVASFAKSTVCDVKNSIFQRFAEISRKGGSKSYAEAMVGSKGGVDFKNSSMNYFLGREVLYELLTMAKVGIYVDMPQIEKNSTLLDQNGKRPYLYAYKAEEILSWTYLDGDDPDEFSSLLLVESNIACCPETHLPIGAIERYRHVWIGEDGFVHVQFYNDKAEKISAYNEVSTDTELILNIKKIPFVVAEISESLLADVANHQIALTNMESSDVAYVLNSNLPFYVEKIDPSSQYNHLLTGGPQNDGSDSEARSSKREEVKVGATQGRGYSDQPPAFIHPSPEPLKASMEKQRNLKDDIRTLINLSLSNVKSVFSSAESKAIDNQGLEAGLSYIGLELEQAERSIAKFWSLYENTSEVATINYPEKYSLRSDADRRADIENLDKVKYTMPSKTAQKELSKQIAGLLFEYKVPPKTLETIKKEIDDAKYISADPETLMGDLEVGVVSLEMVAEIKGYGKEQPGLAAQDHAERLARINEAQAELSVNGNQDTQMPGSGKVEKQKGADATKDDTGVKKERGKGK